MKRFNLSAWAVSHPALVLFLIIALGAAGLFSYQRLGRAEDPYFTVKVVNVSVMWPGATAKEMQTQVADPIEKKFQELPHFEKVQTYSKPGFTAMQVSFKDSTPPKEVPYLFYLLRKKLVDVEGELPSGIIGPVVNDEFSDVDSILFMLTGDGADYKQLKKVAEGFRQRLLRVGRVAQVIAQHGRVGDARANAVRAQPNGRIVERDRTRELQDGPLGRRVGGRAGLAHETRNRADIHHVTAGVLAQLRQSVLERQVD